MTTPASAATLRVRRYTRPTTATRHAAPFARNSGPTQFTSWKIATYCWMCTAASPASSSAPSAYAAGTAAASAAVLIDGLLRGRVAERCTGVLVAKAATLAGARAGRLCGDLVSGRVQREPCGAKGGHTLSIGFARFLILRKEVQRVAVVGELCRPFGARSRAYERGVNSVT